MKPPRQPTRRSSSIRPKLRVLITAGPTREAIDSVRYISNESSGQMGFALAAQAARRGHQVTLVHGPVSLSPPAGVLAVPVVSAAQMFRACAAHWPRQDGLIAAAAVADYSPARPHRRKLKKKQQSLTIELKPTVDILATLSRARRAGQVVIGFALEDHKAREHAAGKLERKGLDAIVLNRPAALSAASAAQEILVRGGGWQVIPAARKAELAARIMRLLEELHQARSISAPRRSSRSARRISSPPALAAIRRRQSAGR